METVKVPNKNDAVLGFIFGAYAEMNTGLAGLFKQRGDSIYQAAQELITAAIRSKGNIEFAAQEMKVSREGNAGEAIFTLAYFYLTASDTLAEIMLRDGAIEAREEARRICRGQFALNLKKKQ